MSRSPWYLCFVLAVGACAAAGTDDGAGAEAGADCDEAQCDVGGIGKLPAEATLPFVYRFQVAPGGQDQVALKLGTLPAGTWLFAQLRQEAKAAPAVELWAASDGTDLAVRTAQAPYIGAAVPAGRTVLVGVDNDTGQVMDGTLSIALSADEAFCGGTAANTRQASSTCDGSMLRVCATDYLQDNRIKYVQVDCASRGGCDAAAGRCKTAAFPLFWCEGGKSRRLDDVERLGLDQDCAAAGGTCGASGECTF